MMRHMTMLAALALAGGCASYTPQGISSMSTLDICELQHMQGGNLSGQARQAIQSELQRRNDNCRNHSAAVAERYRDFMYVETYGRQSP
jgi:hypothetical protein